MVRALRIKEHLKSRSVRPNSAQFDISNETLEDKEYQITVDENFFITGPFNQQNKDFPKVVILGDSIFEGTYGGEGNRVTDHLNKWAPEDSMRYEYLNGCCSGATTLHGIVSYLGKVMPLNPAHVFLFLGGMDVGAISREKNFWTERKGTTPFISPPLDGPFKTGSSEYKYREAILLGLNSMCSSLNTEFHMIIPAISPKAPWQDKVKNFDYSIGLRKEINDVTRRFAKDNNLNLLDLDIPECQNAAYFYDIEHLNPRGHEAWAKQVRKYIQSLSPD